MGWYEVVDISGNMKSVDKCFTTHDVKEDEYWVSGHKQNGKPIMPGSALIEFMAQSCGYNSCRDVVLAKVDNARFFGFVYVGDCIQCYVEKITSKCGVYKYNCIVYKFCKKICSAEITLSETK